MENINNILALSTKYRDEKFPFWTDCKGLFGAMVFRALLEQEIDPRSIDIDCMNRKLTVNGKTKNIKNCSVNGIMKMLK